MKYIAYHRTSTLEQHLERGIAEITQFCSQNSISLYKGKVYCDQIGMTTADLELCHLINLPFTIVLWNKV